VDLEGVSLNWLAVIASVVVMMALGFAWYGPLFGKQWMAAQGRTMEGIEQPPAWHWGLIIGGAIVGAIVVAVIVDWAAAADLVGGLVVGLIVGVGLLVTDSLKRFVYEQDPVSLLVINNGYNVVGFAIMGAILGAWQ
jgi:hypothetical protein